MSTHPTPGPSAAEGPDPAGPAVRPFRLSDAERSEAVASLSEAFAQGRLDADEFEARMSAASQARLSDELEPLFADLPGPRPSALAPRPASPATPVPRGTVAPLPHPPYWIASPMSGGGYPARPPFGTPRWQRPPASRRPAPIGFLPIFVLMLVASSWAFLIPLAIVMLVVFMHAGTHTRRRG